jgi:hypothetical protein
MVRRMLRRSARRQRARENAGKMRGDLREAIALILDYIQDETLGALPPDARQELVVVG